MNFDKNKLMKEELEAWDNLSDEALRNFEITIKKKPI